MYEFTQGETIAIPLRNTDNVTTTSVSAKLKAKGASGPTGDVLATFTVTASADLGGGFGPGWILTLSPATTATLTEGDFLVDARVVMPDGLVEITDAETIRIKAGVTTS